MTGLDVEEIADSPVTMKCRSGISEEQITFDWNMSGSFVALRLLKKAYPYLHHTVSVVFWLKYINVLQYTVDHMG